MTELPHRTAEQQRGVAQRAVGAPVEQGVRELTGEGLRESEIRGVAVREQRGAFDAEELRQRAFEPLEQHMIPRGLARGGHVQSIFLRALVQCAQHFGMARQPEVIAPAKVGERAAAVADTGAVNLLKRSGEHA